MLPSVITQQKQIIVFRNSQVFNRIWWIAEYSGSTSTSSGQTVLTEDGNYESRKINRFHNSDSKAYGMDNNVKSATGTERTEEMPSSSEARPKEGMTS